MPPLKEIICSRDHPETEIRIVFESINTLVDEGGKNLILPGQFFENLIKSFQKYYQKLGTYE